MVVEIGIEVFMIEGIDLRCPTLRDMFVSKQLPDHGSVLAFCQGIVITVSGAGFGELDTEFFQ